MKNFLILAICYSVFLFSFAPQSALADPDCSTDQVSLGEVMAGLQSGLTPAAINDKTIASGYSNLTIGYWDPGAATPRRGFVIPESGQNAQACENDYILISDWLGCRLENESGVRIRTPKEGRDCADTGDYGWLFDYHFEISTATTDPVTIDHMQTATKIGILPHRSRRKMAFWAAGVIIEPFELPVGTYFVTGVFVIDDNRDGVPDFELSYPVELEVFPE